MLSSQLWGSQVSHGGDIRKSRREKYVGKCLNGLRTFPRVLPLPAHPKSVTLGAEPPFFRRYYPVTITHRHSLHVKALWCEQVAELSNSFQFFMWLLAHLWRTTFPFSVWISFFVFLSLEIALGKTFNRIMHDSADNTALDLEGLGKWLWHLREKLGREVIACSPGVGHLETGRVSGNCWLVQWMKSRVSEKEIRHGTIKTPNINPWALHAHAHTYTHLHTPAHTQIILGFYLTLMKILLLFHH